MARRWSKLKSKVESLVVDKLLLRIYCSEIRMTRANDGSLPEALGTFTVRLNGDVIWDFPKQFVTYYTEYPDGGNHYSYSVSNINNLLREYIDTPKDILLSKEFGSDHFGIVNVLKCADRRIGTKSIEQYFRDSSDSAIKAILVARKQII